MVRQRVVRARFTLECQPAPLLRLSVCGSSNFDKQPLESRPGQAVAHGDTSTAISVLAVHKDG